ncbi:MAG: hypothetical protein QXD25_01950 [Nanopusillaceae archaeon]
MDGITKNGNIEQKSSIGSDRKIEQDEKQSEVIDKQELANIIKQYIKQIVKQAKQAKIECFGVEYENAYKLSETGNIYLDEAVRIYTDKNKIVILKFKNKRILKIFENESLITQKEINFKLDVEKLYDKLLDLEILNKFEELAFKNAIKTYNILFNKNINDEDIELDEEDPGVIIKPFYCEVVKNYSNVQAGWRLDGYKVKFIFDKEDFEVEDE